MVTAEALCDPQPENCRNFGWAFRIRVDVVVREQGRVWAGSAGAERTAVVAAAVAVAVVAVGQLEQLEHTVWQHWLEIGSREVVETAGWVGYCEGRDEGGVEQRGVGHKDLVVVRGT